MKRVSVFLPAALVGAMLGFTTSPTPACEPMPAMAGSAGERAAQSYLDMLDAIRVTHAGDAALNERARLLVESAVDYMTQVPTRDGKETLLPAGVRLVGVNAARGDLLEVVLDFPPEWLASGALTGFRLHLIGSEFLRVMEGEPFTRFHVNALDPVTGSVVPAHELCVPEPAPRSLPVIDDSGGDAPLAGPRRMPAINPGQPTGALSGKTIYINQSHGWFDDVALDRWRVQRGTCYGTLEDFDSAEFINIYVLPMLRNAGAKVQTVREPDLQTNMVIVDNADGTSNPSNGTYVESGTWITSSIDGFKQKTGPSWNGVTINPFDQGSGQNRLSSGPGVTTGAPTSTATWTANIPADGYYNVYVSWSPFSGRASDAQYLVRHSGGVTEYRVDQKIDGYTWFLLGNFYFEAGSPENERQVVLTNHSEDAGAINVSADAVRWGGGMGDMARQNNGTSGRPRWEEEAVLYLQYNGFGRSGLAYTGSDDEGGGWADRTEYGKWEHSIKDGSVEDAIYFAFHTNAFTGCGSTARGLSTFRHSTATAASTTLQHIMHDTMYDHLEGQWFPGWTVRGKNETNFGENNQENLGLGLPGFLIEGLFHDNVTDSTTYNEPEFRYDFARAITHGLIDYFEDRDTITLTDPPDAPTNLRVIPIGGGMAQVSWDPPDDKTVSEYNGDAAASYRVFRGRNGFGFDNGISAGTTTAIVPLLDGAAVTYFRVASVNAGGQSFPTETLAAREGAVKVLLVNGFDRNQRAQIPTQTIASAGSSLRRHVPHTFQGFNYVIEHAAAIAPLGHGIASASNEALIDGQVSLAHYDAVVWIAGEESTNDHTFTAAEQALVSAYLANADACFFVSGAEIGWDLVAQGNAADESFFEDVLRASYIGDDANSYTVNGVAGSLFEGLAGLSFAVADGARYDAEFPDRLGASAGSAVVMRYGNGAHDGAGVAYLAGPKVLTLGFPFETLADPGDRAAVMERVFTAFDLGDGETSLWQLF